MTIHAKMKHILAFLSSVLLFLLYSGTAHALDGVDMDEPCFVTVSCSYGGVPLEGMTVRLYRVADISVRGKLTITPEYAESGAQLDELDNSERAREAADTLLQYRKDRNLPAAAEAVTDADGNAASKALQPGLYLVNIDPLRVKGGEYSAETALVALPGLNEEDETWSYSLTTYAKIEFVKPKPTPHPGDLPDTGQLQWPVPVLAVTGLALVGTGYALCRSKNNA